MRRPGAAAPSERKVDVREVVNGLMYVLSTGCQWRAIPKDLPPRSTIYDYFDLWSWEGALNRIHDALYLRCVARRPRARRARPPPSSPGRRARGPARASRARKRGACVDPPGYDAGKKIKGKKRHVLVDTQGLLMHAIVHAADIQDRDGGALVVATCSAPSRSWSSSVPTPATKGHNSRAR